MRPLAGFAVITSALALLHCSSSSNDTTPANHHDASVGGSSGSGGASTGGSGGTTSDASDAATPVDDISSLLEPLRASNGLPALAGAVWKGGTLVAQGVTGVRKQGDPTPAALSDQWHLGSDTKAMTATLIGIYVDRGVIHFDDTIATLFSGETIDPGYSAVTIVELLQHRGGAPGTMPADIWSQMWTDGPAPDARSKAVLALISRPPAQAPGTYVYANAGYMIAGHALERLTGKTWENMIQADLFGPLAMSSCAFGAPGTAGNVDEPWGHDVPNAGDTPVPIEPGPLADNPPSMGPAGTVHCALADWGKFLNLHLAAARGETTSLVSQATMQTLQTPASGGDYACGWIIANRAWAGGNALTHSGSNTYWFATAWLAPAKNTVLAVVTNRGDDVASNAVDSAFGPLIQKYIQ